MPNINKMLLKIKMLENNMRISDLAEEFGVSEQTIYNRISGKTEFSLSEIRTLRDKWDLSEKEIIEIFLN